MNATSYLVLLFPLALTVDMVPGIASGIASRILMMIALLGGFAAIPRKVSRSEMTWVSVLVALLVAQGLSTIASTDFSESVLDLGRQAYITLIAIGFTFSCRFLDARRFLVRGMILPALFSTCMIGWAYHTYGGGSLTEMKAEAVTRSAIVLNAMAGTASMSWLLLTILAESRWTRWIITACGLTVTWMSGSRTSFISLVLALGIVAWFRYLGSRSTRAFLLLFGLVLAGVVALLAVRAFHVRVNDSEIAKLTSGRFYLWQAAWDSFKQRPIFGSGAGTWRAQLASAIPMMPMRERPSIRALNSGAYHSGYLTWLAERGILVTSLGIAALWVIFRRAWMLFRLRDSLVGFDRRVAEVAPIAALLMVLRELAEVSGILSYANAVDDFLGMIAGSLIIAVASAVEAGETEFAPGGMSEDASFGSVHALEDLRAL